jgi:hypothetical protein
MARYAASRIVERKLDPVTSTGTATPAAATLHPGWLTGNRVRRQLERRHVFIHADPAK